MNVECEFCDNIFTRSNGRYNEAVKNGWRQFCSSTCQNTAKTTSLSVTCSNIVCRKIFLRKPTAIRPSGLTFCSHKCAAKYTNIHRVNPMSMRRSEKQSRQPKCQNPLCNKRIKLENYNFCSMKCRMECAKENDKISVIKMIREFYSKHGRIPVKYELTNLYSRARIGYGTWNKAIQAAGSDCR